MAFTIPIVTRSTIPAHEASAIASIRAINEAEMIYASSHPDMGFTADLAMLGGTTATGGERTIDNTWPAVATCDTFTYTPGDKGMARSARTRSR